MCCVAAGAAKGPIELMEVKEIALLATVLRLRKRQRTAIEPYLAFVTKYNSVSSRRFPDYNWAPSYVA